jgi:hypothetical protein
MNKGGTPSFLNKPRNSYRFGREVGIIEQKAKHCYELATMNEYALARHSLGCLEGQVGMSI